MMVGNNKYLAGKRSEVRRSDDMGSCGRREEGWCRRSEEAVVVRSGPEFCAKETL